MQTDQNSSNNNQKNQAEGINLAERIRACPLPILHPIIVINGVGVAKFSAEEISVENIGQKACGLISLPLEWVPPFFVISASCFEGSGSDLALNALIVDALRLTGISTESEVMVRSSGTSETIHERGQLPSKSCFPTQIATTIQSLISQISKGPIGKVHWIVQKHVKTKHKGHLSNQRRVREDKRDWLVEFEPQKERRGFTESFAVRRWRDGREIPDLSLSCSSEFEITLRLKRVAMWATQLSSRTLFEWVWDGGVIFIVQVDVDQINGIDPRSLLPEKVYPIALESLQTFHPAKEDDYQRYSKLRNAKMYGEIGYTMPTFYVANNPDIFNSILSGQIPVELQTDLYELTKRPLIIRTDGTSIPEDKREMLPRSDELRSFAEAKDWLLSNFKLRIEQNNLSKCGLCLIAHHFIPSVSSAWAYAEPGKRVVRIESLWGIPEGLYWYSHDTFEVDTQNVAITLDQPIASLGYRYRGRKRFKGTFIGPDKEGRWKPHHAGPPYDWKESITKQDWLFEIAHTTRQVAERENQGVSVMWFIDNHTQATAHKVLPWFHSKSELSGPSKAAPRRKLASVNDFTIKDVGDWERLKELLRSGMRIERVIVEPIDIELIRNPEFARELGRLAASTKFVVELSGGILSHAYYLLQSSGAEVECIDLYGAEEDVVEYNKVVRDKIPSLIEGRGERVETVTVAGSALIAALRQKLVEEAFEALDAKSAEELIGELADVEEVIRALCQALDVSLTHLETEREEKRNSRGGFDSALMLIKTSTPHSIPPPLAIESPVLNLKAEEASTPIISEATDLPSKPIYRRPDLRQVDQQREKLFTFEVETNKLGDVKETLNFLMPMDKGRQQNFTLIVELKRTRSSVRGVVRLRVPPSQLEIDFPNSERNS